MKKYKFNDIVKYNGYLCKVVAEEETGVDGNQFLSIYVFLYEKAINYINSPQMPFKKPSDMPNRINSS